MPLDVRAVYGTGGTTLSLISTAAINDGAPIGGMPLKGDAGRKSPILLGWGVLNVIADTLREAQLLSSDQYDARSGEYDILGASSLIGIKHYWTRLPFGQVQPQGGGSAGGIRSISIRSNTAAGLPIGYYLDDYPGAYSTARCSMAVPNTKVNVLFGGALTAQTTWGNVGLAPTPPLKGGRYAILGAWVNALTNYAVIRFSHADFNGYKPGFPVADQQNTTVTTATRPAWLGLDDIFQSQGFQFVYMDQMLGTGCPVFTVVAGSSTGLTVEAISATADTLNVNLVLGYLG